MTIPPGNESEVPLKAKASPTKAFFVRMLTRDISLDDCILDLIDNSIDGAWNKSKKQPSGLHVNKDLEHYNISITITTDSLTISDNCGGITLDDAVNYAFTFGRTKNQTEADFTVGVYGIGMKRAAFKIGNYITIDSTYLENGRLEGFRVPIKVLDWLVNESEDWDFDIEELPPADEAGVDIVIREISEETRSRFTDPTYTRSLRRVLGRDYMVPLMRSLSITINGEEVIGQRLQLNENDAFKPMRDTYQDGAVTVEILAGMFSKPPDSIEPDEGTGRNDDTSGWYVICNGRVVLEADRSSLTGWGVEDLPRWHLQYTGFVGVLIFSSKEPLLLPMTTTKRSVDVSSAVYRRALPKIQGPTRAWIDYTNRRKGDDTVRQLETGFVSRDISEVAPSPALRLPTPTTVTTRTQVANVNYAVPLRRMRRLAAAFGHRNMGYRDVGLRAFDYAFENLVDEDDT